MKSPNLLQRLALNEDLNFLLTNRVPRAALTRFMGWFSRIRQPLVRDASMAVWKAFTDLDLSDAKKTRFDSLHDCFTRELRDGARPVDSGPDLLVSPCDAIVGACGPIGSDADAQVFQAKGFPYTLRELIGDTPRARDAIDALRGGTFVTLRLTSAMYHRFHAPDALTLNSPKYPTYLSTTNAGTSAESMSWTINCPLVLTGPLASVTSPTVSPLMTGASSIGCTKNGTTSTADKGTPALSVDSTCKTSSPL